MYPKMIFCIGGALIDEAYHCLNEPLTGTSNPATCLRTAGGVARNVAGHLAQLGHQVRLISCWGKDADGQWLNRECTTAGIGTELCLAGDLPTGRYACLIKPTGELFTAAVISHFEETLTKEYLINISSHLQKADLIMADTNLSTKTLEWLVHWCDLQQIPLIIEPVSVPKAKRLSDIDLNGLYLITPNEEELKAMTPVGLGSVAEQTGFLLMNGVQQIWVSRGPNGSTLYYSGGEIHYPAPKVRIINTSGAGDAALAGYIHGWSQIAGKEECMTWGHSLAAMVLESESTSVNALNHQLLINRQQQEYPDES